MSYVQRTIDELKEQGIYSAMKVDANTISKIINLEEWEYYSIDVLTLESYLGLLAQQINFLQQEVNTADAREIELSNDFKMDALPCVIDSKIRSVEERWIFASTISDGLRLKFDLWQRAVIKARLLKDLSEPATEKLNVLKKIYDDRRMEGRNKSLHKYTEK